MCVDSKDFSWERPVTESDLKYFETEFPNVDFKKFMDAMSKDGGVPLTTDMALIGGMLNTQPDDLGMCYVPFTGFELGTQNVVKLPVMDQMVEWFENTALGTDMWNHASDVSENLYGGRFHFAMNCGCGFVANNTKKIGNWSKWQVRFNNSRRNLFGRTKIIHRTSNDVRGLDITKEQLAIWERMRRVLEALPASSSYEELKKVA
jgi:hypothetical protein